MKNVWCKVLWSGMMLLGSLSVFGMGTANAATKSCEFGNVVMHHTENSETNIASAVTFRHWSHRDKYTCRLCHVDLEFSQFVNGTGVTEEDNKSGMYCGACHNKKEAFSIETCTKCHPENKKHEEEMARQAKVNFRKFKKNMPAAGYGNKIDWMKAEDMGKIKLKDFLEGVSFNSNNQKMTNRRNEPLSPTLPGLPGIIFSHQKHVVWCGCGMCHPDTFALETGKTQMNMREIAEGKYCGRCHSTIAFALNDCTRCHSTPVSR